MQTAIFTYGHIDAMFYTLNAIAMISKSSWMQSLVIMFAFIGFFIASVKMSFLGQTMTRPIIMRLLMLVFTLNILLIWTTNVNIVDKVKKQTTVVDNIPWGFAIPITILETIGANITALVEQAFTPVSGFNFSNYGMTFGAALVQEFQNMRIQNPQTSYNIDHFFERCVVPAMVVSESFTPEELFNSKDLWADMKRVYSKDGLRSTVIYKLSGKREIMNCTQAMNVIEEQFQSETQNILARETGGMFGQAGNIVKTLTQIDPRNKDKNINGYFMKNMTDVYRNFFGIDESAEKSLRQIMLMHSYSAFITRGAEVPKSIWQQENSWEISSKISSYYLPMLLSVMKCLVYGAFIFILPLAVLQGSFSTFGGYLLFVASFQLWAPLYAILNMFIDLYTSDNMMDIVNGGISFATFSKVGKFSDKIVAIAGGLQLSVPFIATMIMKGSWDSLVHLAGNMTGMMQSSISAASSETTSGNRSYDNVSVGNMSMHNNSGFKHDTNSSFKAGSTETQAFDGSLQRVTPNASVSYSSGAGINKTTSPVRYVRGSAIVSSISKNLSEQEGIVKKFDTSYRDSEHVNKNIGMNIMSDLTKNLGKLAAYAKESGTDESKQVLAMVDSTIRNSKEKGQSTQESYDTTMRTRSYADGHVTASGGMVETIITYDPPDRTVLAIFPHTALQEKLQIKYYIQYNE